MLSGDKGKSPFSSCEIETGDGEKRRFRGGDILLVEDVTGRGRHRTRRVNNRAAEFGVCDVGRLTRYVRCWGTDEDNSLRACAIS